MAENIQHHLQKQIRGNTCRVPCNKWQKALEHNADSSFYVREKSVREKLESRLQEVWQVFVASALVWDVPGNIFTNNQTNHGMLLLLFAYIYVSDVFWILLVLSSTLIAEHARANQLLWSPHNLLPRRAILNKLMGCRVLCLVRSLQCLETSLRFPGCWVLLQSCTSACSMKSSTAKGSQGKAISMIRH